MSTNTSPQFEEKRFALRMALRLPIVVSELVRKVKDVISASWII
jgi:hypothetical protein